jgi:death-on-curing protein
VGPVLLNMDRVMRALRSRIDAHGGVAGVRDAGLLNSASAMPQASFAGPYLQADLFEIAAASLYPIGPIHPVLDRNKRAGADLGPVVITALNLFSIGTKEQGPTRQSSFWR